MFGKIASKCDFDFKYLKVWGNRFKHVCEVFKICLKRCVFVNMFEIYLVASDFQFEMAKCISKLSPQTCSVETLMKQVLGMIRIDFKQILSQHVCGNVILILD